LVIAEYIIGISENTSITVLVNYTLVYHGFLLVFSIVKERYRFHCPRHKGILMLNTRWRRIVSFMLLPIYPHPYTKRTPVPIELKAGLVPKDGLDSLKKGKRQDR